jgi:E3 ubiquitin-protein ligase TRIP12
VDDSNLEEYLTLVLDMTLGSGIARQIKSLQDGQYSLTNYKKELMSGFSTIMPINDLKIFSPEEIGLLIGNAEEDWSKESMSLLFLQDLS